MVAVANVGDDLFWTGHPLAQANLYTFGRLAWDPRRDPTAILDEWITLTFPPSATADAELVRRTLHEIMDDSWRTYERYTAPLGVGFMVNPGDHYGPGVDGYEYTRWGTYHFADRDGVGVDRSRASGTGFAGQYPPYWAEVYESPETCPDELLLFFHHVPYGHVLHSGSTVIQHIYDTHFAGVEEVTAMRRRWQTVDRHDRPERVRAGRRTPRRAGALRHRVARPDQHVLLPQVRGAGRARAGHPLSGGEARLGHPVGSPSCRAPAAWQVPKTSR